jgi:hypothetical protein
VFIFNNQVPEGAPLSSLVSVSATSPTSTQASSKAGSSRSGRASNTLTTKEEEAEYRRVIDHGHEIRKIRGERSTIARTIIASAVRDEKALLR